MTMMTHNLIRYSGIFLILMFAAAGVQAGMINGVQIFPQETS